MNFHALIEKLKSEKIKRSPGNGYYKTYVLDDIVIKEYMFKENFDKDIQKHKDLDDAGLLPRMLGSLCTLDGMYLFVEKIDALGADLAKKLPNDKYKRYLIDGKIDDFCKETERDENFINELKKIRNELSHLKYFLEDIHALNFGYKDGRMICLDEGCFFHF
jgi:hypothetical protein